MIAAGVGLWGQGRGYKTRLLAKLFPTSAWALKHPAVTATRPGDLDGGVMPDDFIAADVNLPNRGHVIDKTTLEGGVQLLRGNAREKVPAVVNTSGGGDAIVLRPLEPLALNAIYTFEVLPALRDTAGKSFDHYKISFTTAGSTVYSDYPAAGVKVALPTSQLPTQPPPGSKIPPEMMPSYTGVTVGPDRRLYAGTSDGRILRHDIHSDGTLGPATTIETIQLAEAVQGKPSPRLLVGLCFDPASTADDLRLWVTHGQGVSFKVNDWTCKLSLLTGANLEHSQDYLIHLPRARLDHATNQCVFGPDGALYMAQASNTAMGAPDHEWGFRPEHLLSAAILRVDVKAITRPPLDVKTDEGGSYDPYSPGAPVTLYATGARNAFDLLWHSNGHLYAPINGSARGGNAPATPADGKFPRRIDQAKNGPYTGPAVPALNTLPTQPDFILDVEKGAYYGHPNPTRAEYVMNGGNPTNATDGIEVPEYHVGTQPDRNWRPPAYNFGRNLSPCGLIEYKGNAFPSLKGKILVARYSGGKDVAALTVGDKGEITNVISNLDGFARFHDPVDLCEDPQSGLLYVAEYGGRRITLIKPAEQMVSNKVYLLPGNALNRTTGPTFAAP